MGRTPFKLMSTLRTLTAACVSTLAAAWFGCWHGWGSSLLLSLAGGSCIYTAFHGHAHPHLHVLLETWPPVRPTVCVPAFLPIVRMPSGHLTYELPALVLQTLSITRWKARRMLRVDPPLATRRPPRDRL